jgi:two-component system aerobic respiration control sensor histidine kinase ArcB
MLLDTQLTTDQRQQLQTINVSAVTLGNIFNDIIDMDKFDRRKLELYPETVDFDDFVSEIATISGLMIEQRGLHFSLDRLTDFPAHIEVDATRLRQVLWNLIGNARKFTKEGSVVMSVAAECSDGLADITFEVEDTGIGIPEHELDNIFSMYYQVKSDKDNLHAVGTGIGLSVSSQIVHLMGGDISVSSEEGFGSIFTVRIQVPVVRAQEEESEEAGDQPSLRIFMVEDIELNITVAQSLLESLGHNITVAMTGEEAIETFDPDRYDLVLLDIQLPDMTGFDIARHFRETYRTLPPLVALTANVLKEKKDYTDNGMDDVLSKPLSVKDIKRILEQCRLVVPGEDPAPETELVTPVLPEACSNLLDLDMLSSYIEIVGVQPVVDSIDMFEEMMPDYIEILDSNLTAQDQKGIVSEAHKIKGAAGSIGLKRIQSVAQKAQSPDLPVWWENIEDWVEEIKNEYGKDIAVLRRWLSQQQ